MHRQAIIMADGQGKRWRECLPPLRKFAKLSLDKQAKNVRHLYRNMRSRLDRLPHDKHLISIDGETLLQRQVRLLRENGVSDIHISSRNHACEVPGATRFTPIDNLYEVDRFLSTRHIRNDQGQIIFIYGDVFYSEAAMQSVCAPIAEGYLWFGRSSPGACPGQRYPELFAFSFAVQNAGQVEAALRRVRQRYIAGEIQRCIGWDVYGQMQGLDAKPGLVDGNFVEIDDITDDFDSRRDYHAWLRHYRNLRSTRPSRE